MLNFIRINEYIIKADDICYIKEVGCGCHIVCKFGTIDIAKLDEGVLDCIYGKLNETTELEPIVAETTPEEVPNPPEINCVGCIWSHCRMCSHFCMTTDYTLRPGVLKVRCSKYGYEQQIEEEAMDTHGPDDWR